MRYEFIDHHRNEYPVRLACTVLEVSASGYYAWQTRGVSDREQRRQELSAKIRVAFAESRQTYGSPRLYRELVAQGTPVCRNTVAKLMRQGVWRGVSRGALFRAPPILTMNIRSPPMPWTGNSSLAQAA